MKADLLIRNATLVTPVDRGGPCRGARLGDVRVAGRAAIEIVGGRIASIGRDRRPSAARTIDARGLVVTPGLVDPHTHVVYAGSRAGEFELRVRGASYERISRAGGGILATVRATRRAGVSKLVSESLPRLRRMLHAGTTTAEVKSGYGLTLRSERNMLLAIARLSRMQPVRLIPTFLGAHAVPPGRAPGAFAREVAERMIPAVARLGIARYCDVFCEPGWFSPRQAREILQAGLRHGLVPKIHADEFARSGGAALAVELGAASADHLGAVRRSDVRRLASSRTVAVLLPGTMYFLGRRRLPPARDMIEAGCAVALGTDCNPGSNMCASLPMAMNQACVMLGMSPAEALTAATLNAAYACGEGGRAGALAPGRPADLVLWDLRDWREIAYEYGSARVRAVIKAGRLAVGAEV